MQNVREISNTIRVDLVCPPKERIQRTDVGVHSARFPFLAQSIEPTLKNGARQAIDGLLGQRNAVVLQLIEDEGQHHRVVGDGALHNLA